MNGFVTFVGVIGMELLEFTKLPKMKEFLTRTGASSTDDIAKYGIEKEFFASFEENLPLTPRRKAEEWWSTTYSNSRSLPDPTQESDQKALAPWDTPAVPGQAIPSSPSPILSMVGTSGTSVTVVSEADSKPYGGGPWTNNLEMTKMEEGVVLYTDRHYKWTNVPEALTGSLMVRNPCHSGAGLVLDVNVVREKWVSLTSPQHLSVLVAHGNKSEYPSGVSSFESDLMKKGFVRIEHRTMKTDSFPSHEGVDEWRLEVKESTTVRLQTENDLEFNVCVSKGPGPLCA